MKKLEFLKEITTIIKESEDLDPPLPVEQITFETHFQYDLQFDSLALMGLLYELQEKYPDLDENQIDQWKRVDDLIDQLITYTQQN